MAPHSKAGRGPLLLVAAAVATALLSGCAAQSPAPNDLMTQAQTQAEYDSTVAHFPYELPQGQKFPATIPAVKSGTLTQKGGGLVKAYQYAECAWEAVYLAAKDKTGSNAQTAIKQLQTQEQSKYRTQHMVDPDQTWKKVLSAAALGDASQLEQFYQTDCTWYRKSQA